MTLRRKNRTLSSSISLSSRSVTIPHPFPRSPTEAHRTFDAKMKLYFRNPQFQFRWWCMAWTLGIVEGAKKTGEWFASSSYMHEISPLSVHWKLQQHRLVRISNFSRGRYVWGLGLWLQTRRAGGSSNCLFGDLKEKRDLQFASTLS